MSNHDDLMLDNSLANDTLAPVYVGFLPRFGAAALDFIINLPLIAVVTYVMVYNPNLYLYLGIMLLAALYKPGFEAWLGATPGKLILKQRVVNAAGERIGFGKALVRALPWLIGSAVSVYVTSFAFDYLAGADYDGFMEYGLVMQEYAEESDLGILGTLNQWLWLLPLVSAFGIFFSARKQAAHDVLAETFVVSTKDVFH